MNEAKVRELFGEETGALVNIALTTFYGPSSEARTAFQSYVQDRKIILRPGEPDRRKVQAWYTNQATLHETRQRMKTPETSRLLTYALDDLFHHR